jgi:LysM repeat protein
VAPATAVEARLVPAPQPAAVQVQIAMLPPRPVEPVPAPKLAAAPAPSEIAYLVRESSRLDRLAVQLGLPAMEIARANDLSAQSVVHPGQRLVVPSVPVSFDGQPLVFDAPATVADGRAIVPFRAVIEEAGGQVSWDSKQHRASAVARGHEIAVTIGSDQAQLDGSAVAMGTAARIRCDRTVVSLRFLGDALDLALQYQDGIIHIASAR